MGGFFPLPYGQSTRVRLMTPVVYITDHDLARLTAGETLHKTQATVMRLAAPLAPKVRMTVCPKCGGCGEWGPEDEDCPRCDGTGQVEDTSNDCGCPECTNEPDTDELDDNPDE